MLNWVEHDSFVDDVSHVTSIEYDNCVDLVWLGHANGRISSYGFSSELQYFHDENEDGMFLPVPPTMERFSSFPAVHDTISQILPNHSSLVSVSFSKIRMLTHGGAGLGTWSLNHCPKPTMMGTSMNLLSSSDAAFTCADLIRDPTISRTSSSYMATSVIAGTSANGVYLFDLSQAIDSPVMVYNVAQPSVRIQSNGHVIAVAGQDGCLRLLDGKFRSNEVTKVVEAHSGPIRDVCMQGDGRTLITCGMSKRAINPYDFKSPFQYGNDVQIRVFDLRMNRMVAPLQVAAPSTSASGVGFLRLIPEMDTNPVEFASVLMCTADGVVQVSNLTAMDVNDPQAQQQLYSPLSDASEILSAAAVSPSGQFLAVGTSRGALGHYARPSIAAVNTLAMSEMGMKSTELYKVNEASPNEKSSPPRDAPVRAPLLSFPVDAPVVGSAFVLNAPRHTSDMLSSSFAMTPAVYKRKLRLLPTSRISEELLRKCSARQDFIRIIPNPGYRPNSMKNVPKVSTTVSATGMTLNPPYAVCDPRKLQLLQHQQFLGSNAGAAAGKPSFQRSNSQQGSLDGQENTTGEDSAVLEGGCESNSAPPPKHYLRLSSSNTGSKQRFKKFDYTSTNDTPFVGLENNVPNSLINPILQLFYALPSLRDQALLSQLSPYHHQEAGQGSVLCELGFLFHMIRLVGYYSTQCGQVDRVVRAANFQRIFQTLKLIPEAVALSLFDETLQSDLQQFIQILTPFLLRLLAKEIEQESSAGPGSGRGGKGKWNNLSKFSSNAIDDIFGFSTISSTTFLHSGTRKMDPKHNRAMSLDLIYPSLNSKLPTSKPGSSSCSMEDGICDFPVQYSHTYKVTGQKDRAHASFAAVLWGSFQREMSMKGWCAESDAFEPFKKVQSLISLPKVLTLLCGNTQADVKDSTTLAGAMGETIGQGSTHSNFWSHPLLITVTNSAQNNQALLQQDPLLGCTVGGSREFAWLPVEIEVAFKTDAIVEVLGREHTSVGASPPGRRHKCRLIVSCRCVQYSSITDSPEPGTSVWIVFDGANEDVFVGPASSLPMFGFLSTEEWKVQAFDLMALVLQVTPPQAPTPSISNISAALAAAQVERKHLVLQLNKFDDGCNWHLFNDFVVQKIPLEDVVSFPSWKNPCIVCFAQKDIATMSINSGVPLEKLVVPASVLQLESLSRTPSIRLLQSFATLPGPGDLIAFDGEFVSVSLEKSMINAAGERVVSEEVRQVLARISLLDMGHGPRDTESLGAPGYQLISPGSSGPAEGTGATAFNKNMMRIIADDYILPVEPVLDYVTRFSGITEEDLNPVSSKHSILTQRAAYLKLRYFIDAKCIFVGHGLQKDFETANIFVPPEQIRDTVELWRLPNQRKISLRFLASYILKEDIQDEIHDSIEDAKTSLLLYRKYKALAAEGPERVSAVLQDLYAYGNRNNWTIGMDKLATSIP